MSEHQSQIDATAAHDLLRECHTRRLDREGIPMVLALVDERDAMPRMMSPQSHAEGAVYADLLGEYATLLTPTEVFRRADEGAVIVAMQVLAYAHFAFSNPRHSDADREVSA